MKYSYWQLEVMVAIKVRNQELKISALKLKMKTVRNLLLVNSTIAYTVSLCAALRFPLNITLWNSSVSPSWTVI